jgi:hypothetical protein
MRFPRTRYLFPLIVFTLFLTTLAHADFQAGKDAYDRGDYATAFKEWQPLAEQGDVGAQFYLGVLYANGHGVPQDYAQAAAWYRKAAAQGLQGGQYYLGRLYARGQGVPQDYVQAHMWYNLAAAQCPQENQWELKRSRKEITTEMTPAQIAEAQRLAREWKPSQATSFCDFPPSN